MSNPGLSEAFWFLKTRSVSKVVFLLSLLLVLFPHKSDKFNHFVLIVVLVYIAYRILDLFVHLGKKSETERKHKPWHINFIVLVFVAFAVFFPSKGFYDQFVIALLAAHFVWSVILVRAHRRFVKIGRFAKRMKRKS